MPKTRSAPGTIEETISRFPRLTAHLICESLGYFTPEAAANAILHHRLGHPFYCEWYMHLAGVDRESVLEAGKKTIRRAFINRHHHVGYMSHYPHAHALVEHVRGGGRVPEFASWF